MEFTDETLMPFGKYHGITLENVPAKYLLWMGEELEKKKRLNRILNSNEVRLLEYIEDNQEVLQKEVKG